MIRRFVCIILFNFRDHKACNTLYVGLCRQYFVQKAVNYFLFICLYKLIKASIFDPSLHYVLRGCSLVLAAEPAPAILVLCVARTFLVHVVSVRGLSLLSPSLFIYLYCLYLINFRLHFNVYLHSSYNISITSNVYLTSYTGGEALGTITIKSTKCIKTFQENLDAYRMFCRNRNFDRRKKISKKFMSYQTLIFF